MQTYTKKLTYGAMCVAIYAMILLINRQSGGFFSDMFLFLFPIPMIAYSAIYGWKSSIPVLFCMIFSSLLFGTVTTLFYGSTEALIGMVYGSCLHAKKDSGKTMLLIMALSAAANLISSVALASLFGMDVNTEISEMQRMMNEAFERAGLMTEENAEVFASLFNTDYLRRVFVISMAFLGVLQGFIICQLSLILLRRLHFPVQKPRPVHEYYPPRWTGYAALFAFFLYSFTFASPASNPIVQNICQTAGMFGFIYLLCFGMLCILLYLRSVLPKAKILRILAVYAAVFLFPQLTVFAGFFYISTGLHLRLMEKITASEPTQG